MFMLVGGMSGSYFKDIIGQLEFIQMLQIPILAKSEKETVNCVFPSTNIFQIF